METTVVKVYKASFALRHEIPVFNVPVPAGTPEPISEYIEGRIDINEYLIKHPASTFYVRVRGDSMIDESIHPGDLLVVDRAIEPAHKKIVIAILDGELTVKKFEREGQRL